MQSTMHLYPINGKARSVKSSATPWQGDRVKEFVTN